MPSLTMRKTVNFVPDVMDNRKQEAPFYLKVQTGLTKVQVQAFAEAYVALLHKGATGPDLLELVRPFVAMGEEPLDVLTEAGETKRLGTLDEYAAWLNTLSTMEPWLEMVKAVQHFNSVEGTAQVFYERLSGGEVFTLVQSAATPKAGR